MEQRPGAELELTLLVAVDVGTDQVRRQQVGRELDAAELGIASERSYENFAEMAQAETARDDGIDVVAIVTPNHLHYAPACAFLDNGIDVICDKPMTNTVDEALEVLDKVRESGLVFCLTHNYTGYPLVKQARAMIRSTAAMKSPLASVTHSTTT